MNPTNTAEARKAFLANPTVAPQFTYKLSARRRRKRLRSFPPHDALFQHAQRIVRTVLQKYGSYQEYVDRTMGTLVSKPQAKSFFKHYLAQLGAGSSLQVRFSTTAVAGTSVGKKFVTLRDPSTQRSLRMRSTCDHELGTHYLRRYNDQFQPWHGASRAALGVRPPSLETEEGLASLHSHLGCAEKAMFHTAFLYCAAVWARERSFVQLYHHVYSIVKDTDKAWQTTLRVKRGLEDQTTVGAYCKDQVYLVGAFRILKSRHHINFAELYAGRIPLESLHQCIRLRGGSSPTATATAARSTTTTAPAAATAGTAPLLFVATPPGHARRWSHGSSDSFASATSKASGSSDTSGGCGAKVQLPAVRGVPRSVCPTGARRRHGCPPHHRRTASSKSAPPRASAAIRLRATAPGGARTARTAVTLAGFGGLKPRFRPPVVLPPFMQDMARYLQQLDELAAANFLE